MFFVGFNEVSDFRKTVVMGIICVDPSALSCSDKCKFNLLFRHGMTPVYLC